jgi:hypothetical protein
MEVVMPGIRGIADVGRETRAGGASFFAGIARNGARDDDGGKRGNGKAGGASWKWCKICVRSANPIFKPTI